MMRTLVTINPKVPKDGGPTQVTGCGCLGQLPSFVSPVCKHSDPFTAGHSLHGKTHGLLVGGTLDMGAQCASDGVHRRPC
eukprot:scaffold7621_cov135-Isochrysis_galbana.AAC.1